jgi:D-sedoheptulose 7-phosphate isomerase
MTHIVKNRAVLQIMETKSMNKAILPEKQQNSVNLQKLASQAITDGIKAVTQLKEPHGLSFIENASLMLADCFRLGNKVLIAGNGGSLCDSCHFAEELTGFFRKPRPALPAIALSEASHITCTANDLGFEWIFSRCVEAYGKPGDIFVGLTTSGNSPNIIRAIESAKLRDMKTILFLGKGGGKLKSVADLELVIDGFATSDRIQEAHMTAIHIIIELIEHRLFS